MSENTTVQFSIDGERKGKPVKLEGVVHNPFAVAGHWLRGNLHCHLKGWTEEAPDRYRELGYDFIAAMDHDQIVMPEPREDMIFLPGAEMSPGHLLVFGVNDMDDIKAEDGDRFSATLRMIRETAELGGMSFLAHPLWNGWTFEELQQLCRAGLNGMGIINSCCSGHGYTGHSDQIWHALLSPGKCLAAIGGDDAHGPGALAGDTPWAARRRSRLGWTGVLARERTAEAVLNALRAGRTYASEGPVFHGVNLRPDGNLTVRCSPCVACHFRGKQLGYGGRSIFPPDDREVEEEFVFDFAVNGYRVKDQLIIILEDEQRRKAYLSPLRLNYTVQE